MEPQDWVHFSTCEARINSCHTFLAATHIFLHKFSYTKKWKSSGKNHKDNFLKMKTWAARSETWELKFSTNQLKRLNLISATKTQKCCPRISPQNQSFSKNRGFVTWRIKFSKNKLAILPKFLKAKNSLLGPSNQ